jgi:hypothetical protein
MIPIEYFPLFLRRWSSILVTATSPAMGSYAGLSRKARMDVRIIWSSSPMIFLVHVALVLIWCCLLFGCGADWLVVSLALICSFSRMRSHLGLEGDAKPETVPEETVLAVADILRRSTALRVSEDGKLVISTFSSIRCRNRVVVFS